MIHSKPLGGSRRGRMDALASGVIFSSCLPTSSVPLTAPTSWKQAGRHTGRPAWRKTSKSCDGIVMMTALALFMVYRAGADWEHEASMAGMVRTRPGGCMHPMLLSSRPPRLTIHPFPSHRLRDTQNRGHRGRHWKPMISSCRWVDQRSHPF